ncbi:MAG: PAS domain S-box protein [Prolixibacteraceae bacterium]|nr:PAS domain S-box protein [Prolixibacteraceae bacterium]
MQVNLLFDQSPIGFAHVDSDKRIIYVNKAFCTFIGYSADELIGMTFPEITFSPDIDIDCQQFNLIMSGEIDSYRLQKRYVHKTGKTIWGDLFVSFFTEENISKKSILVATVVDITDFKENEARLRDEKVNFKKMFTMNPQAMLIYSAENLDILEANGAASELCGYPKDELLKLEISDLLSDESKVVFQSYRQGGNLSLGGIKEWTIQSKSGEKLIVESNSHICQYKGIEARHVMAVDITERKKAGVILSEKERSISHAQEIAKMGSWDYDILNDNTSWSANLYKIFQVDSEDVSPSFDFFMSKVHPEDHSVISEAYELLLSEKKQIEIEHRILLPNNEALWIQNRIEPFFENDRLVSLKGVNIDITERKNYELLIQHRMEFESILNTISSNFINSKISETDNLINETLERIGVFLKEDRIYLFRLDQGAETISNTNEWCREGIQSRKDMFQQMPVSNSSWLMQQLWQGKLLNCSDISEVPDETEREILNAHNIVSILVIPMFYEQELKGLLGFESVSAKKQWDDHDIHILRSITDMISIELARCERERELIAAKERAEESSILKSAFLATISHELRTPLNPIIGFSELLIQETDDSMVSELATIINDSGNELLNLLEDLFDLSFAMGDLVKCNLKSANCLDLYCIGRGSLEEILIRSGKSDQIQLSFPDCSLEIGCQLLVDQAKILQVLSILFKNAVKFTYRGQIEFGVELERDKWLRFTVRDTGIGFEKDKRDIIFDYFRQIDNSNSRPFGGLGIGLSIAKRLVDVMGGTIEVESKSGEGSSFIVSIPVSGQTNDSIRSPLDRLDSEDDFSFLNGKTILVVDDNQFVHEIIGLHLQTFQVNIMSAKSGYEAIEIAKEKVPDFIFMDLVMPGMSGFETTLFLKAMYPRIPISAITAHSLPKDRQKAFAAGCDEIITKPIYRNILLHMLKRHLKITV